jgi:metal-responsive CopG/Arc/MetJ family transcriptional regulator
MPVLTSGNTVYTHPVAKVMISIPDALLERLDARAKAAGETRSGLLQRLAEREVQAAEEHKREEISRLLDQISALGEGDNTHIDVAQMVREDRESH